MTNHIQTSITALSESHALATNNEWRHVQFTRSKTYKGYTLLNLPARLFDMACLKLFISGCEFLACGQLLEGKQLWITINGPQEIMAKFAQLFPCPDDAEPLVISESGDRILTGWAAAAVLKKQAIIS